MEPLPRSSRRARVSDAIAARIKKDISNGLLVPGEKLPAERELAHRLKTSRLSVREAYRSLEELGLLSIRRGAGGGAFINRLDHQPIARSLGLLLQIGRATHEQLTEARLLLEPPVARLAARRASPEDIERLEGLIHQQQAALKARQGPRRLALEFHRLVAQCARNLPLEIVMNSMADLARESIVTVDLSTDLHRHIVSFHRRIVSAIRRHDEDAADELMRRHVLEVHTRLGKSRVRPIGARRAGPRRRNGSRRKSRR